MTTCNLAFALYQIATRQPDDMALALPAKPGKPLPRSGPIPYHIISFKSLADETNCIGKSLLAWICAPVTVVLMVAPGLNFSLCFAFLQSGSFQS
jgi:hypothetical protein